MVVWKFSSWKRISVDQIHSGGEGKTRAAGAQKSTLGLKEKEA